MLVFKRFSYLRMKTLKDRSCSAAISYYTRKCHDNKHYSNQDIEQLLFTYNFHQ